MNNTVLITGASGGIGRALAEVFASHGDNLILCARGEKKLAEAASSLIAKYKISASVLAADLTEPNAAQKLAERCEKAGLSPNIIVNNAGFGDYGVFLDSDLEKQRNMIALNVSALVDMTYVFGNIMRKRGSGRILNIASCAAFAAGPYMSIYYASKAFVLSFSQAVAEELRGSGVTVTALCLGPASTGFEKAAAMSGKSTMFKKIRPVSAESVAKTGYKAVMSGRTVKFHGAPTIFMSLGSRFAPRILNRRFAAWVNGKKLPDNSGSGGN